MFARSVDDGRCLTDGLGFVTPSPPDARPLAERELRIERLEAELRELQEALRRISDEALATSGIPDRDKLVGIKQVADRALAASSEEPG